jgi:uncharacterized protein YcbK (DUF882 family)
MYDLTDKDGVLDFYIGLPNRLDKRAKNNGFRTNLAWLFTHEYLHGVEQLAGYKDRVHSMEEQGRLKELYEEHKERAELVKKVGMLTKILELMKVLRAARSKKKGLQPLVRRRAERIVEAMGFMGHPVRIVEGYRSEERQNELYAQGRTKGGNIVTNAKGGESYHNYGVAVDFVFRNEGYNASKELWETLGVVGESQGFNWGGRWSGFTDKPHFEMTFDYQLSDFQKDLIDYKDYK